MEVREVVLPLTSRWQSNQTGLQFYTADMAAEDFTLKYTKSYDHLNLETDTSSETKQALIRRTYIKSL